MDWEAEPPEQETQEPEVHIPHINNNQYVELARNEDDEENETTMITTLEVQEWRTMAKPQECNTTTKSQDWLAITRARG